MLLVQFFAIANTFTVKKNGVDFKLSSIEDIFELKNGNVSIKEGVEFPREIQNRFIRTFRKMSREIGGAYRSLEQTQLETEWWGQAAMFMKKYFVPLVSVRYAGERYSSEYNRVTEGFHRSAFRNFVDLFRTYHGNVRAQWENLTTDEKIAYHKAMREYAMILAGILLFSALGGGDDKKELEKNNPLYNFALVALMRANSEIQTFNIPFGTNEFIRIVRTPFMATQAAVNIYNTLSQIPGTLVGADDAFYKQNTGLHEKGDSKLIAAALKSIGYSGNTIHLANYITNYRNQQNQAR